MVSFNLQVILLQIPLEALRAQNLDDTSELFLVVPASEEVFLTEDLHPDTRQLEATYVGCVNVCSYHGRKHASYTPQIQAIVVHAVTNK